jgi:hypothetical protein
LRLLDPLVRPLGLPERPFLNWDAFGGHPYPVMDSSVIVVPFA